MDHESKTRDTYLDIVVLDEGIEPDADDIESACCAVSLVPAR